MRLNSLRLQNFRQHLDTYVNFDPTAEMIAETTVLAAQEVRRFGHAPRVALLSHSSFGATDTPTSLKMREALDCIHRLAPNLEAEGRIDDRQRQRAQEEKRSSDAVSQHR